MFSSIKPLGPIHPDIRRATELLWDQHNPSGALSFVNTVLAGTGYTRPPSTNATFCFVGTPGCGGEPSSISFRTCSSSFSPSSVTGTTFGRSGPGGGDVTRGSKGKGIEISAVTGNFPSPQHNGPEIMEGKGVVAMNDKSPKGFKASTSKDAGQQIESELGVSGVVKGIAKSPSPVPIFADVSSSSSSSSTSSNNSSTLSAVVRHVKGIVVGKSIRASPEGYAQDLRNCPSSSVESKKTMERSGNGTENIGLTSSCFSDCGGGGNNLAISSSSSSNNPEGEVKLKDKLNAIQLERLLLLKADALSILARHDSSLQEALAAVEISQGSSPVAYFTVGREYRFLWALSEAVLAFQKGESIIRAVIHECMRVSRNSVSGRGWASTQYFCLAYWNRRKKYSLPPSDSPCSTPIRAIGMAVSQMDDTNDCVKFTGSASITETKKVENFEEDETENFWASEGFSPEEVKEMGLSIQEYHWQQEALKQTREDARQQKLEKRAMEQANNSRAMNPQKVKRNDSPSEESALFPSCGTSGEDDKMTAKETGSCYLKDGEDGNQISEKKKTGLNFFDGSSLPFDTLMKTVGGRSLSEDKRESVAKTGQMLPSSQAGGGPFGVSIQTFNQSPLTPRPHTASIGQETACSGGWGGEGWGSRGDSFSCCFSTPSSVASLSDSELLSLLGMDQYELSVWRRLASDCRALLAVNISQTIPSSSFSSALTTLWPKVERVRNGVIVGIENNSHENMCFVGATLNGASHVEGYSFPPVIPKGHSGIVLLQTTSWSGYHGGLCFEIENSLCCFFYFEVPMLSSKKVGVRLLEHRAGDLRLAFDEVNGEINKSGVLTPAHPTTPLSPSSRGTTAFHTNSNKASQVSFNSEPLNCGRDELSPSPNPSPHYPHYPPTSRSLTTAAMLAPVPRTAATIVALQAVRIPSQSVWLSSHSAYSSRRRIKVFGRSTDNRLVHFVVTEIPSVSLLPVELLTALEYAGPLGLKKLSAVSRACRTLVNHLPPWIFRSLAVRNPRLLHSHSSNNNGGNGATGGVGGSGASGSSLPVGNNTTFGGSGGGGATATLSKLPPPPSPMSGLALPCAYPVASNFNSGNTSPLSCGGKSGSGAMGWLAGLPFSHSLYDISNQLMRSTSYPDYLLVMDRSDSPWVVRDRNVVRWKMMSEQRVGDRLELTVIDSDALPAPSTYLPSGSSNSMPSPSNTIPVLLTICGEIQSRNASIVYGDNVHRRTVLIQLKDHRSIFMANAIRFETPLGNHFATITTTSQGDFDLSFVGYGSIPDKTLYTARKQISIDRSSSHLGNGAGSIASGSTSFPTSTPAVVKGEVVTKNIGGTTSFVGNVRPSKTVERTLIGENHSTTVLGSSGRHEMDMNQMTTRTATTAVTTHAGASSTLGRILGDKETCYSIWRPKQECGAFLLNGPSYQTNSGQELIGEITVFSNSFEGRRRVAAEMKLYPGADGLLCSALCYSTLRWQQT